jgi:hypothetical protein
LTWKTIVTRFEIPQCAIPAEGRRALFRALDRHRVRVNVEGDRHAPLKPDNAQSRPKIVTSCPALSSMGES